MNLIKYAVRYGEKDGEPIMDCILVEFNPRQSKKVDDIQEDFFSVFSETLSKYDSNIASSLNHYLVALGLSIDNPLLTFFLKLISHDSEESRENINKCLLGLPQRVIVFIDDFDRLTAKEMVEVFKLIDKNASFKKVTFVTAFDQGYVENVLGGYFGYGKNTFADKFFTLEYNLPIRPFATLLGMLYDLLRPQTTSTKSEEDALRNFMFNNLNLFQLAIKNVRDVKRFYNQFIVDYVAVKDEVILYEYIVVELMKYRYREDFDKLKNHEYLNEPGLFGSHGFYTLKEECRNDKSIKALPLLEYLFAYTLDHLDVPKNYKSIKRVNKFDTYFRNKLYGQIPAKDFEDLYSMSTDDILSKFDTWLSMNLKGNIVDYVAYQDWQFFKDVNGNHDWQHFSKFVEIAILLAYKTNGADFNLRVLISRMLYKPNLEECNYYGKTEAEYRDFMIESLYGDFSRVPLAVIADFIMQLARKPKNADEQQHLDRQVIDLPTYQAKNVEYLRWYISQHKVFTLDALRIYQICIKEIAANDKVIIIDEANSIMREYIENDAKCTYLHKFIRYHIQDNAQYVPIQCEPFCKQIFSVKDNKDPFAEYVAKAAIDDELRKNIFTYWTIYKNKPYNEHPLYKCTKGTNPSLTQIVNALR